MSNINQNQFVTKIQLGKNHCYMALAGAATISIVGLSWILINRTSIFKSINFTKTAEYNSILYEHVDLSQVTEKEVNQSTTLENLSERFGVYRFNHNKLYGKWGNLYVLIDRRKSKTISRSLLQVNGKAPKITVREGCFQLPQVKNGVIEEYKTCI
jgi:hypothetical protein